MSKFPPDSNSITSADYPPIRFGDKESDQDTINGFVSLEDSDIELDNDNNKEEKGVHTY